MTQLDLVTTEINESPDGQHVWSARKIWSNKPHLNFILPRPPAGSLWDHKAVIGAHQTAWLMGYGGVVITFLLSKKPPLSSISIEDITSPEHREVVLHEALAAKLCIVAWGDLAPLEEHTSLLDLMGKTLRTILDGRPVICAVGIHQSGHPAEPSNVHLTKPAVWVPYETLPSMRPFLKNTSPGPKSSPPPE